MLVVGASLAATLLAMSASPNTRRALCALCALHSKQRFSMVDGPPNANGSRCSRVKNRRSSQRRPRGSTKVHWPPSRSQTCRATASGTWRESVRSFLTRRGLPAPPRRFSSRSMSSSRARSKSSPRSPLGRAWLVSSRACSILARSAALAVNCTR